MKALLVIILLIFMISSCSMGVYNHYPRAKKNNNTRLQSKTTCAKKHYDVSLLGIKNNKSVFELRNKFTVTLVNGSPNSLNYSNQEVQLSPPGDGKPRDATQTNKKAKRAFISSIIALGSLVAGFTVAPIFLLLMVLFAAVAFFYSSKALKEIKRTGEYGKTKAEFALYTSIPILVLSVVGLVAYLMSNGTGIQIGSFVLR